MYQTFYTDVTSVDPDKKSIMMYVMCYFQVLSQPQVIIEDAKEVLNDVSNLISNSIFLIETAKMEINGIIFQWNWIIFHQFIELSLKLHQNRLL